MNKPYRFFLTIFLCSNVFCYCFAQQKTEAQFNNLANFYTEKFSLKPLSNRVCSKDLFNLPEKEEAFVIYSSNEQGKNSFIILSGDEKMAPVLAYSDENSFDSENMPPAVKAWLESYIQEYKQTKTGIATANHSKSIPFSEEGVSPLLNTIKWGQSQPYNNNCPLYRGEKTLTGCVATAMAQVMKYYSYPEKAHGFASYLTSTNRISVNHDFSKDIFDWESMLDSYNSTYSDKEAKAVSTLMASCGAAVEMDYGTSAQGGSGAYQFDLIKGYIDNYDYDKDASFVVRSFCSTEDWHRLLVTELNAGRPVNYAGASMRDGGHSFVLDGYRMSDNTYPDYHVNWGWNGSCDGYYQIANLHPQENGQYGTTDVFSQSQQMTIGVMPDDGIDNASYLFASSALNCSLNKVKQGTKITFNISSLYNYSYKQYSGNISVALKNQDNELVVLGNGKTFDLKYMEGTGNVSFVCTIPSSITLGNYQACLVYQNRESGEWREILSSSYPTIKVSDSDEEQPAEDSWSELGCSEFELVQKDDKSVISANLYELINLQTQSFDGSLVFTLADENGSQLFNFGDRVNIPELGYNDYLTDPIQISGKIERELSDGYYRLYISSKGKSQKSDSYVVQNELSVPGLQTKEMYHRVTVRKHIAYIGDKEFELPTQINSITEDNPDNTTNIYSLDGKLINTARNIHKGVYISKERKVIFK